MTTWLNDSVIDSLGDHMIGCLCGWFDEWCLRGWFDEWCFGLFSELLIINLDVWDGSIKKDVWLSEWPGDGEIGWNCKLVTWRIGLLNKSFSGILIDWVIILLGSHLKAHINSFSERTFPEKKLQNRLELRKTIKQFENVGLHANKTSAATYI